MSYNIYTGDNVVENLYVGDIEATDAYLQQGSLLNQNVPTCDSTTITADSNMAMVVDTVATNIRAEFDKLNDNLTILYNL